MFYFHFLSPPVEEACKDARKPREEIRNEETRKGGKETRQVIKERRKIGGKKRKQNKRR